MSQIAIQPVRTSRQRRHFLSLAYQLNAGHAQWVPPLRSEQRRELDPRRNPFYEHADAELFVAYRDHRPIGRIAAIENRLHNQHANDRVGFFGYYEAVDDQQVSAALFTAAEEWLHSRGLDRMRGPTNPSMNTNIGFLIDGFEYPPAIPMPYTQPYYPTHADAYGLKKAMQVLVYGWDYGNYTQAYIDGWRKRIERLSQYVERTRSIRVRGPRLDRVDQELQVIREICNESLKNNWGFVPMTDGEMQAARRELERIIDPEMFFIAEVDERPEAVFLACPDYNELLARMNGRILPFGWIPYLRYRRKIRKYVVYVYASTPRAEAMGAAAVLYKHYFDACFRKGIMDCETGYVLETNTPMRNSIENLGGQVRKRYQLYEKPL
ncbi:MAG: hypothetical protein JJ992_30280 [Planctomycetes bacterium]|nr:hypothetical protein [Planctomycetota bacterium]